MTLVAKDASDSLVLVGLGFARVENTENWAWFMTQANNHIEQAFNNPNLVLITDWEKGLNRVTELDFFSAVLSRCTEHAFKNLLLSVPGAGKLHKTIFTTIVMAGNAQIRAKLLDDFARICGDAGKNWIMDSIVSYGLIEMVEAGICCYGDTTSNMAEQMNWSINEMRRMGPIDMIVHATAKFLKKKARKVIQRCELSNNGQQVLPVIQEKAVKVRNASVGRVCTLCGALLTNDVRLEYYVRKSIHAEHWETVEITIPENGLQLLTCTCLRPLHMGILASTVCLPLTLPNVLTLCVSITPS